MAQAARLSTVRLSTNPAERPHIGVGVAGMSSRKFSERREVLSYRQQFAAMWRDFIRANFESPEHAAYVFRVDNKTAQNWWEGSNAPSGWVVGRALSDPDMRDAALAVLTGDAA